jgi:hypothetical protein
MDTEIYTTKKIEFDHDGVHHIITKGFVTNGVKFMYENGDIIVPLHGIDVLLKSDEYRQV